MTDAEIKHLKRQNRELRKALKELVGQAVVAAECVDYLMGYTPSDVTRGRRIASALNALDLAIDTAAHFGLSLSFARIARTREKARKLAAATYTEKGGK